MRLIQIVIMFVIPSSGKHTFQIEYLGDAYLYFPYIYLKELKVLKPIAAEEVTEDEYTLEVKTCPNGYQVKGYYGERNDGNVDGNANDKVNTPNTLDTVWQYGLLLGFGSLFILVSYFVRKKVNS